MGSKQQPNDSAVARTAEPLSAGLPDGALLLVDSAPIIFVLEGNEKLAARFRPLLALHAKGKVRFAITTITLAEVLIGPLQAGDEALASRYRAVLGSWQMVALDAEIAV